MPICPNSLGKTRYSTNESSSKGTLHRFTLRFLDDEIERKYREHQNTSLAALI